MDVIVFCVFIIFGVTLWLVLSSPYTFDKNPINEQNANCIPFLLKPDVQLKQKSLFKDLVNCLHDNNFTYWLTDSTLLYAINHQKLMPWEDKISINVLHKDLVQLVALRNILEQSGKAKLVATKKGYLYCENNMYQYPCIDIFIMDDTKDFIHACNGLNELGQCQFDEKTSFEKDLIFPLMTCLVEQLNVCIPRDYDKLLVSKYGKDYKYYVEQSKYAPVYNKLTMNLINRFYDL